MGANGTEITEGCDAQSVGIIGVEIGEHRLNRSFERAVRVDQLNGGRFRNWDSFGEAIDRGAADEDKVGAAMGIHGCENGAVARNIEIP